MVRFRPWGVGAEREVYSKEGEMAEQEIAGETIIEDDVVATIAGYAARQVDGVTSLGRSVIRRSLVGALGSPEEKARVGVGVEVGKKEAIVELSLGVMYGRSIPGIVQEVRRMVGTGLQEMTGLIAKEINVTIISLEFPEPLKGEKSR